jgi:hypothetical protein
LNLEHDVHEIVSSYQFKMKELELDELEKYPSGIDDISKMAKVCSIQMVKSKKIRQVMN